MRTLRESLAESVKKTPKFLPRTQLSAATTNVLQLRITTSAKKSTSKKAVTQTFPCRFVIQSSASKKRKTLCSLCVVMSRAFVLLTRRTKPTMETCLPSVMPSRSTHSVSRVKMLTLLVNLSVSFRLTKCLEASSTVEAESMVSSLRIKMSFARATTALIRLALAPLPKDEQANRLQTLGGEMASVLYDFSSG